VTTSIGTAYVDVDGDWSRFDRAFARKRTQTRSEFAKAGTDIGRTLGASISSAATLGVKTGAVALVAAVTYSVKKAADFEAQLSSLKAVTDANASSMGKLRKQAIDAGKATKFSAQEAAEAQTELAKGGLNVQQILSGGLNSALALAAAGELDLADAAATTVNAMKLFKIPGKDSIKVADALASAANRTTADVSDFAAALQQGGSAAQQAGLDFNDTIAALEALAEVGIKGSDAGTSLKTMLIQLASPTSAKAAELTKKLGINVFDAHGRLKDLADISGEVRKAFKGMSDQERISAATTLVGQDGFRALLALYDAGPQKIDKFVAAQKKKGTADDVAKKKQDNLKGSFEQLSGSVETLGIQVGTALIPALRDGADGLTDFTNDISDFIDDPKLSIGDKLEKSFEIAKVDAAPWIAKVKDALDRADIPEHLADAISAAAPQIADAAGHVAPLAAGAFVKTWVESSVWGRIAIGGFLLSKMGGLGAFKALGAQSGAEFGKGMAAGAAPALAGVTVAAGPKPPTPGKTRNLTKGNPLGDAGLAGSAPGLTHGDPLATTAVGVAAGKSIGQGIPTGIAASGLKGKLTGLFSSYGPGLALALTATLGPSIAAQIKKGTVDAASPDFDLPRHVVEPIGALVAPIGSIEKSLQRLTGEDINKLQDFGDTAEDVFKKLSEAKDARGLGELANQARVLAREFPKSGSALLGFADAADEAARKAAGSFKDISTLGGKHLKTIIKATAEAGFDIKNTLGSDTAEGKKALAANYAGAAEAIKKSMDKGVISTKTGTEQIEQFMVLALQNMGFSKDQALKLRKGQDPTTGKAIGGKQNLTGKQSGGSMVITDGSAVVPGSGSGDKVHLQAMVEPGEEVFVLNRNATKKRRSLETLNAAVPRFQRGGSVTGDTDFLPALMRALQGLSAAAGRSIFVQSGRRTVAEQLAIGPSTPGRPVAGPNGPHVRGVAADITPGFETFGKLAGRFGLGFTVMPQEPWHIQLLDALGGPAGGIAPKLARAIVDGPDSPLKSVVQGALDTAHGAAQSLIDRIAATTAPELGESAVAPGGKGFSKSQLRGLWIGAGGPAPIANLMAAIALAESGGDPQAHNPSGASGLWQILGVPFPGDPFDPETNARMAVAKYESQGLGAWEVYTKGTYRQYLQRGGLLGLKKGGPAKGTDARLLGFDFSKALSKIKTGKTDKLRSAASKNLIDAIGAVGFPQQAATLTSLENSAELYGDYADRASRLTDSTKIQQALEDELKRRQGLNPLPNPLFPPEAQQAIVDSLLGRVGGKTQLQWLTDQIGALFDWRNVITDTDPIVLQLKEDTVQVLAEAQKQLETVTAQIKKAEAEIARMTKERDRVKGLEEKRHDQIADEMDKPAKKRNQKKLKQWRDDYDKYHALHQSYNAQLQYARGEQRGRNTLKDSLEGDVIPALEDKRDTLDTSHNDLLSNLKDVQGPGGPLTRLPVLPPIGTLGGKLFDVQALIKDLTDNPPRVEATPPDTSAIDSQKADLLQGLLDQAHLRTAVSEATFKVFQGADDLLPPFGGSFDTGGFVPGRVGEPRTIIAHGGERVLSVDELASGGFGGGVIQVIVQDGAVNKDKIKVIARGEVQDGLRREARRPGRGLPGVAGVN
jgi:TP901 family phage tail tape measure protein